MQGVKIWWRKSTLEDTLEDKVINTNTNTNILVHTKTLLCQLALQQPDQAAGWLLEIYL